MSVSGYFKNDSMLRQITEAVRIDGTEERELINTKEEWNYVSFPRVAVNNGRDDGR